jgi:hypothetical protein
MIRTKLRYSHLAVAGMLNEPSVGVNCFKQFNSQPKRLE